MLLFLEYYARYVMRDAAQPAVSSIGSGAMLASIAALKKYFWNPELSPADGSAGENAQPAVIPCILTRFIVPTVEPSCTKHVPTARAKLLSKENTA